MVVQQTVQLNRASVKIVHHHTFNVEGKPVDTYGILVNGRPRIVLYSESEVNAFLKGLGVENGRN